MFIQEQQADNITQMYQLRAGDGWLLLTAQELAVLGLQVDQAVSVGVVQRRVARLDNNSVRSALEAMLDQEEPEVLVTIHRYVSVK